MNPSSDLEITIAAIRIAHRQRCFAMTQRIRSELALLAFIRTHLGWSRDKDDAENKKISDRAKAILAGKDKGEDTLQFSGVIQASEMAKAPFEKIEDDCVKDIQALAVQLPTWASFGEPIVGFGAASLGSIIGEAGDLSVYANPAKLWKRMGLAVMGDVRQGGLPKGAPAELWIEHGYSRQRRSRMWLIGDAIIKRNGNEGPYRSLYLARKQYEIDRNPEIKPIVAHRRAQRYLEKRLLRNLWRAWRDCHGAANDEKTGEVSRPHPLHIEETVQARTSNPPQHKKRRLPGVRDRSHDRTLLEKPRSGNRAGQGKIPERYRAVADSTQSITRKKRSQSESIIPKMEERKSRQSSRRNKNLEN